MKTIETNLTEKIFLERLDSICEKKRPFDRGYETKDTFVCQRKEGRFRIYQHSTRGRWDGCYAEYLSGKYKTNEKGKITVEYRFKLSLDDLIPAIVTAVLSGFVLAAIISDLVTYGTAEAEGVIFLAVLLGFSIFEILCLALSKRVKHSLEAHLKRICKVS